jgi:hypothetical protein
MRVYYPDEVDDFLEVNVFDEQFTNDLNEAVILGGSKEFWRKWSWVVGKLPDCQSLEEWLTLLFKFVVNETYGDGIFGEIPA